MPVLVNSREVQLTVYSVSCSPLSPVKLAATAAELERLGGILGLTFHVIARSLRSLVLEGLC